jgi:hypothetical protein
MKTQFKIFLVLLLSWGGSASADTEEIAVIVNKANPIAVLSHSELRPIFQTTKTSWPSGQSILALTLPAEDATRKGFDAAVLGLDPDRVARYWVDRKIRGGNPAPKALPSPALMAKAVGSKAEAIGFVLSKDVTSNVKVVAKIRGGQVLAP